MPDRKNGFIIIERRKNLNNAAMATYYPPVGFHFKVEFPGIGSGDKDIRFQEVSGLTATMGVEPLEVGGENRFSYQLPTKATYSNLILKRGMLTDSGLITWFRDTIENFEFKPVDMNVHLLNENHEVLCAWKVLQAYPVKWTISNFSSTGNTLVIETIELAFQYFQRQVDSPAVKFSASIGFNASISAGINVSAGLSGSISAGAGLSGGIDVSAGLSGGIDVSAGLSGGIDL